MLEEKFKYDYWRYNKHFVLKPSIFLKLSLVFLSKDVILALIIAATNFKTRGHGQLNEMSSLYDPVFCISNMPAVAVLMAMINRTPESGALYRLIWKYGRHLMALSVIGYLATLLYVHGGDLSTLGVASSISATVTLSIIVFIFSSRITKDTFSEFPNKEEALQK